MKYQLYLLAALCLVAFASAAPYELNYTAAQGETSDPHVVVRTLKYDPYPVNPGDWFDLWLQVENPGQLDAEDVSFTLEPSYPFHSATQMQQYAVLSGTRNAHGAKLASENGTQANTLLLKYRVFVDESAGEGTQNIRLHASYRTSESTGAAEVTYNIPITIEKTKTAFVITMQDSNSRRTTFTVLNSGEKAASAITVTAPAQLLASGSPTVVLGTLNPGEFTTVSFALDTNASIDSLPLTTTYTDVSGARASVNSSVPVSLHADEQPLAPVVTTQKVLGINATWVYGFVGLLLGIIIAVIISRRRQ